MSLKEHFLQRKLVYKFYLYSSLDKIVEIKFLSEPYSPPLLGVLSLPALSSLWVWEGLSQ
jgi:hypothetical protein